MCPGAGISALVGVTEAQGVLGLVLAHWRVEPGPRVSDCRALAVPELVDLLVSGAGA